MMDPLRQFLNERKLELCTKKIKIVITNNKGCDTKAEWKWEGKGIKKVKNVNI